MRTAISPRFATSTFLNILFLLCPGAVQSALERDVSVFPGRIGVALVLKHLEGVDQTRAGFAGFDDIVDESPLGGHITDSRTSRDIRPPVPPCAWPDRSPVQSPFGR